MSPLQLLTVPLVVLLIGSALGQLPFNGCSKLFQYQGYQGQFIGLVKVRHPIGDNQTLIVQFSQPGYHEFTNYVGSIALVDDDETTQQNLRQGLPIRYRVDFPIPTVPPKITSIELNGNELCGAQQYPKPRTGITLRITWTPSYTSVYGVNPQPVPSRPQQPWQQGENSEVFGVNTQPLPSAAQPSWRQEENPNDYVETRPRPRPNQPTVEDNSASMGWSNDSLPGFPNSGGRTVPPQGTTNSGRVSEPQQTTRIPDVLVPQQNNPSGTIPCGRERASITPLIFQGKNLERGQLPWLVAIFERRESNGPAFICGGSLISTTTVISAAHCFRFPGRDVPAARLGVSLGRNSLAIQSDGEYRGVSQLVIHENYQIKQFTEADLALVRLDDPVRYNDYIVPICLWSPRNRLDLPQGHKSYVAGWGPDESGTGHSDVSKVTDLNIVIESNCIEELPHVLVQPSTLCAKKTGAGPCSSDGGGPLMLREQDVWVLRGVISGGAINEKERTCELSKPSVFTDVAKHIDWVRRNMWN
ncbi:enteropeptidase [Drosophila eugracilis]|uniref:enteropeptidase n=1 Tax=Drosophila eugracilis TaxID=29029 RepID=UPI001BDAD1E2|nr:enteropeptidase [Drosophila eugracilis]